MIEANEHAAGRTRLLAAVFLLVAGILAATLTFHAAAGRAADVQPGMEAWPAQALNTGGELLTNTTVVSNTLIFLPSVQKSYRHARLSVEKTVEPETVASGPGQVVTYTVTIRNEGQTAATLLSVHDVLPEGFTFLSMAPGSAIVTNPSGVSGSIAWNEAIAMPPGQQVRVIYRVTASQVPGSHVNEVRVTARDASVPRDPAAATVVVKPGILLQDDFENGIDRWTPFLNYHRLEPGQWYWGGLGDGYEGSRALTHDCCNGSKRAGDALMMYLGAGAEEWTDYRVEAKMLLRGGVDADGVYHLEDGDPIGLWVRGQYEYEPDVTIRAQWVTGYYVVIAGKPTGTRHVVRLSQMQTLEDCWGDACNNPQNLYCFNNPHILAEVELPGPFLRYTWYKMAVEVRGDEIKVWLNDEHILTYVDETLPFLKGTVGFKTHETKTASFDDIVVTPLY